MVFTFIAIFVSIVHARLIVDGLEAVVISSTNGTDDGLPNMSINDFATLHTFYTSLVQNNSSNDWMWRINTYRYGISWDFSQFEQSNFTIVTNPCSANWQGIVCICDSSACFVEALVLSGYGIVSSTGISANLTQLSHLTYIDLSWNNFNHIFPDILLNLPAVKYWNMTHAFSSLKKSFPTFSNMPQLEVVAMSLGVINGTIGPEISNLQNLRELYLTKTSITGTIPLALTTLPNLEILVLDTNIGGHGPLPSSWTVSLKEFYLASNAVTGTIPAAIALQCPLLKSFELFQCSAMSGTIPTEFSLLQNLQQFSVKQMYITGTLPAFTSPLLKELIVYQTAMTAISSTLLTLTSMRTISLTDSQFHGTIPSEWLQAPNLLELSLNENQFTGTIPAMVDIYTNTLEIINLGTNKLTGSMPQQFGGPKLKQLIINYNNLTGNFDGKQLASVSPALNYLFINNNLFTGSVSTAFCDIQPLVLVDIALTSLCYPACLYSVLSDVNDIANLRCYGPADKAICTFISSTNVQSVIEDTFTLSSTTIESAHPFNQFSDVSGCFPISVSGASKYFISFNSKTHLGPVSVAQSGAGNSGSFPGIYNSFQFGYKTGESAGVSWHNTTSNDNEGWGPVIIHAAEFTLCKQYYMFPYPVWGYQMTITATVPNTGWKCDENDMANACTGSTSSWTGVQCLNHQIISIDLSGMSLKGSLPAELANASTLQHLDLRLNDLTNSVPDSLGSLSALKFVDLSSNRLVGTLSATFGSLSNLQYLYLSNNLLTGTVPDSLAQLPLSLQYLYLSGNELSGRMNSELCALRNVTVDVTGTKIACFEDCWAGVDPQTRRFGSMSLCSPTAAPTASPKSSDYTSRNKLAIIIGSVVGGAVFLLCLSCLSYRRIAKNASIQPMDAEKLKILRFLPVHNAIVTKQSPAVILQAIAASTKDSIYSTAFDGLTASELAIKFGSDEQVVLALMRLSLPWNFAPGKDDTAPLHGFAWHSLVQVDAYNSVVQQIIDENPARCRELAEAVDDQQRVALHIATKLNKQAIQQSLLFFKRYQITTYNVHQSKTSTVHLAIDFQDINKQKVALKFMIDRDQFLREKSVRTKYELSERHVMSVINSYDSSTDPAISAELARRGLTDFLYCVVMPAADKPLDSVLSSEQNDPDKLKQMMLQAAKALNHMHTQKVMHGDIKPANIMRCFDTRMRLIDLDNSAEIGLESCSDKTSSAYLPPEMVSHNKIMFIKSAYSVKTSDKLASAAVDVWALGVVFYQLLCEVTLFHTKAGSSIVDSELENLYSFSDDFKKKKLEGITDLTARNLVAVMLTKNPVKRPPMSQVIVHPYFSGRKMDRLPGEAAQFDVFISYRVNSDKHHAERIYHMLTNAGVKVWWDKMSLKPGVSWEEGFCDGLANCKVFLPIISRNAINKSDSPSQNFTLLNKQSPCDNFLLELRLAGEFQERGQMDKVYPVLVGDLLGDEESGDQHYANYFESGCSPNLDCVREVVVQAVESKLEKHLDRLCLGSTVLRSPSVAEIVQNILRNQACVVSGPASTAFDKVVVDIGDMLGISSRDNIIAIADSES